MRVALLLHGRKASPRVRHTPNLQHPLMRIRENGHRLILGLFKLALSMQHLVPGCSKSSRQDLVNLGTSPRQASRSSGRTVAGTADPEWEEFDAIVQGPHSAGTASHQEDSLGMFSILFRNELVYSRLCILACASLCSCFRSRTSAPGCCSIGTTMRWPRLPAMRPAGLRVGRSPELPTRNGKELTRSSRVRILQAALPIRRTALACFRFCSETS